MIGDVMRLRSSRGSTSESILDELEALGVREAVRARAFWMSWRRLI
jgi:hypothetical protein